MQSSILGFFPNEEDKRRILFVSTGRMWPSRSGLWIEISLLLVARSQLQCWQLDIVTCFGIRACGTATLLW